MSRPNYSVTAFSHHAAHRPPSFCKTPRQHRVHAIAEQQQHGNMLKRLTLTDKTRSADMLHSHSKDGRSDRIVTMRWITSNMYTISAGTYCYSYIIIPATINHNNVYTITNYYIYIYIYILYVSLLFYTHAHRHYSERNLQTTTKITILLLLS